MNVNVSILFFKIPYICNEIIFVMETKRIHKTVFGFGKKFYCMC